MEKHNNEEGQEQQMNAYINKITMECMMNTSHYKSYLEKKDPSKSHEIRMMKKKIETYKPKIKEIFQDLLYHYGNTSVYQNTEMYRFFDLFVAQTVKHIENIQPVYDEQLRKKKNNDNNDNDNDNNNEMQIEDFENEYDDNEDNEDNEDVVNDVHDKNKKNEMELEIYDKKINDTNKDEYDEDKYQKEVIHPFFWGVKIKKH